MIVKNEAHVIQRCLRSVRPFIDSYSISDTGSTDNTLDLIREELAGLPGVLMCDPWLGYGPSRNVALSRSSGSHILWLDADEVFVNAGGPLELPAEVDYFEIMQIATGFSVWQRRIIRNVEGWRWQGMVHEVLVFDGVSKGMMLNNIQIRGLYDSHQNIVGNKYLDYLDILKGEAPTPRNVFYHASTLFELERYEEAIAKYDERVAMGGWEEEVYYSLWKIGECKRYLSRPFQETAGALFAAYVYRPSRFEALASLCSILGQNKRWQESYQLSARSVSPPGDALFVMPSAEWRVLEEHALAAFYLGKKEEAREYFQRVAQYDLDPTDKARIKTNLSYCT